MFTCFIEENKERNYVRIVLRSLVFDYFKMSDLVWFGFMAYQPLEVI